MKALKFHKALPKLKYLKHSKPAAFILGFAVIGSILIFATRAATPFASLEVGSSSSTTPPANVIADDTASGGSAIQFGGSAAADKAGVFITRAELDRAKTRGAGTTEPFKSSYNIQKGRADSALSATPNPFYMEQSNYLQNIKFAWSWSSCPDNNTVDDSLSDAVAKLEKDGDLTRTLAMQYALSGDSRYANKAKEFLLAWTNRSTPVNMYDFFVDPVTFNGGLRGDNGTTCYRPWNMALDGLFQGYGLINFADTYVLLTRNGYSFTPTEDAAIKAYILSLTEAVNSSFHTWTRWADNHTSSDSFTRYRTDNHLSWGQAPLIAAAVALGDQNLANYVLNGGTWNDSRSGPYTNPSPIRDVINRAILTSGRVYDEAPESEGGLARPGYAFYHLWPMQLVARTAEVHYAQDIWNYKGTDGKGLEAAYDVEADKILSGADGANWQYELVYNKWPTSRNLSARNINSRLDFIQQSYGPVVLLFGQ